MKYLKRPTIPNYLPGPRSAALNVDKKMNKQLTKVLKKTNKQLTKKKEDHMNNLKGTLSILITLLVMAFSAGAYLTTMQSGISATQKSIQDQGKSIAKIADGVDKYFEKTHSLELNIQNNKAENKLQDLKISNLQRR